MKKLLSSIAVLAIVSMMVFAQNDGKSLKVTLENKVATDVVEVSGDGKAEFAGAYDQMKVNVGSKYVDAMAKARIKFALNNGVPIGFEYKDGKADFNMVFKPVDYFRIGINKGTSIPGSYSVVGDDNVKAGNIGSSGVTFGMHGLKGVTLAFTIPVENYFVNAKKEYTFKCGLGGWYEYKNIFSIGANFKYNGVNDKGINLFSFGTYGTVTPIDSLKFYFGYTYYSQKPAKEAFIKDSGVNFSASYEIAGFSIAADFSSDFVDNFYNAWAIAYKINDNMEVAVEESSSTTYSNAAMGEFSVKPSFTYEADKIGKFSAAVEVGFNGGKFASVKFPLSWTYKYSIVGASAE